MDEAQGIIDDHEINLIVDDLPYILSGSARRPNRSIAPETSKPNKDFRDNILFLTSNSCDTEIHTSEIYFHHHPRDCTLGPGNISDSPQVLTSSYVSRVGPESKGPNCLGVSLVRSRAYSMGAASNTREQM